MFTWQNSCNSINLSSLLLLQYILTLYHTTVEQGIHWSLSAPASVIPLLVLAWHKALTSHPVCPLGLPGSSGPLHTGETLVSPASSAGLNSCLQASSLSFVLQWTPGSQPELELLRVVWLPQQPLQWLCICWWCCWIHQWVHYHQSILDSGNALSHWANYYCVSQWWGSALPSMGCAPHSMGVSQGWGSTLPSMK